MRTPLILLISLFFSEFNFLVAQNSVTNKTHELSPLKVSFCLLGMENFLTPITTGAMVEGQVKDKIFYNAQARFGILRNFLIKSEKVVSNQKESKGRLLELGTDFVFSDKIRQGKMRIVTSSTSYNLGSTQYTSETFF